MERDLPQQIQGKIFPWSLSYLELIIFFFWVITENALKKKVWMYWNIIAVR